MSAEAQGFRASAVRHFACPRCKADAGTGCAARGGGRYDRRYAVHRERLELQERADHEPRAAAPTASYARPGQVVVAETIDARKFIDGLIARIENFRHNTRGDRQIDRAARGAYLRIIDDLKDIHVEESAS